MTKEQLEAAITVANTWSGRSTLILAIGILGEYALLPFLEGKRRHLPAKIFFAVLVVVGIVGEYAFSKQISQSAAELQRISDSELRAATDNAGKAIERASKADERASNNEKDAAQLRKDAEGLKKSAEDERLARVKLQESVSWRTPDRALIPRLAAPLKQFGNQRYVILSDQHDPEQDNVTSWIVILLGTSDWVVQTASSASELQFPATNIVLWLSPTAPTKVLSAARAFARALESARLPALVFQSPWGPAPDAAPPELIRVVVFKRGPRMSVEGNRISFQDSPVQMFFGAGPPN